MHCVREHLVKRHHGRGHREAANFARVRNPCSKTQCERGSHAELLFLVEDGTIKLSGRDQDFRRSISIRDRKEKSTTLFFKESRTGLSHQTRERMTVKSETISGLPLGIEFVVITSKQESNSVAEWRIIPNTTRVH